MATISIPDFPDDLYARLEALAKANNLSVEAQIIILLEQALPPQTQQAKSETTKPITEILAESRRRRRVNPSDFGLPDSTTLIREDRDRPLAPDPNPYKSYHATIASKPY